MGGKGKQISVSSRLTWSIQQTFGQPRLRNEILLQKQVGAKFLLYIKRIFTPFSCICLCAVYEHMHVHVYAYVCVVVGFKAHIDSLSKLLSAIFSEAGSLHWTMNALIWLVWLSSLLCEFPVSSSCQLVLQIDYHACLPFTCVLGIWTLTFTFEQQVFYSLAHLSRPRRRCFEM